VRPAPPPRFIVVVAVILAAALAPHRTEAAEEESLEYAVKATYLYKLGPFIEWPEVEDDHAPLTFKLCVVGNDPFGEVLDRAVAGQTIANRPIAVERIPVATAKSPCQLMYLSGSSEQSVAAALLVVKGSPILTVTENGVRAEEKGIINFVVVDNRVRFEIDDFAAAESGITISSKVLGLAVSVRRRSQPPLRPT
jgi:hypothetical protein